MENTIDLPDELAREVQQRALEQGRTPDDLVAEYVRRGLGATTPKGNSAGPASSAVTTGSDGLPVVQCRRDAPAVRMCVGELVALERQLLMAEDIRDARRSV